MPAHIGGKFVCLHVGLKCRVRYQQAYRRKGFKCVNGRLQKLQPPPPPPPPRAPLEALPGLYRFSTSQCLDASATLCNQGTLTVLPGGTTFTNATIPYSAECTPPYHYVDVLTTTKDLPLTLDDVLGFALSGTVTGNGATVSAVVSGVFDTAGGVSGRFDFQISGSDSAGTHYECDTNLVTFSGKLSSG